MANLDDILSDKPAAELTPAPVEKPPATEAAPAVEAKDVPKTEPVKAEEGTGEKGAPPAPATDESGVPKERLDAEIAKRKDWKEKALRLEGELKALKDREEAAVKAAAAPKPADGQPAEQVPDSLLDPTGYAEYLEQRIELRLIDRNLNYSEARAVEQHGRELVDEAMEWAKTKVFPNYPGAQQKLIREADPYEVLVKEYQRQKKMAVIGNDPDKYVADQRAKIEAELREKILAEQAEQGISGQPRQAAAPPPSLATARSAAGRSAPGFTGPTPLSSIVN